MYALMWKFLADDERQFLAAIRRNFSAPSPRTSLILLLAPHLDVLIIEHSLYVSKLTLRIVKLNG